MGLMLKYKKYKDRYFDCRNNQEILKEDCSHCSFWYQEKYNDNGNVITRKYSNGYCDKYKYDDKGREIYYESENGAWEKRKYNNDNLICVEWIGGWIKYKYDAHGNLIYSEDSDGQIKGKKINKQ